MFHSSPLFLENKKQQREMKTIEWWQRTKGVDISFSLRVKVKNVVLENEMEFKNESKTQRQVTLKSENISLQYPHAHNNCIHIY